MLGFLSNVLVLTLVSSAAFAQSSPATAPVPRVVFPQTTVGNTVTFGAVTADASNAANFSFGAAANGDVFANTGSRLATAGGASVDLAVAGHIPVASVGAALGRFAARVLPIAQDGFAVYQLAKDLGFLTTQNSDGSVTWQKQASTGCTASPCFSYTVNSANLDYPYSSTASTPEAACAGMPDIPADANYDGQRGFHFLSSTSCGYDLYTDPTHGSIDYGQRTTPIYAVSVPPSPPTYAPATTNDFANKIAQQSGWPTSSTIAQAVRDALNNGESLQVTPDTVTGPATSPGPVVATNDGTNTATSTTTNTYTYNGPSVTVGATTQNTVVNNSTGQTVSTSSTTTSPTPPPPQSCGLPGTPACKIDETGTLDPSQLDQSWDQQATIDAAGKAAQTSVSGSSDKNFFGSWTSFFITPQLVACSEFQLPSFLGMNLGAINPCPAVEYGRGLAGLLWAVTGLWMCIGMVRGVV